jgi:hypothetical protein
VNINLGFTLDYIFVLRLEYFSQFSYGWLTRRQSVSSFDLTVVVSYLVFKTVDSRDAVIKATEKYSRRALKAR